MFGDPQLNTLVEQIAVANQDLKAAEARFREARAMIRFNRAAEFPTISTGPSISSIRDSRHKPYTTSTFTTSDFLLPFDLSYELDLWGRVRRTVRRHGKRPKRPPPTSRPPSSVCEPSWRWIISSCAAPIHSSSC